MYNNIKYEVRRINFDHYPFTFKSMSTLRDVRKFHWTSVWLYSGGCFSFNAIDSIRDEDSEVRLSLPDRDFLRDIKPRYPSDLSYGYTLFNMYIDNSNY